MADNLTESYNQVPSLMSSADTTVHFIIRNPIRSAASITEHAAIITGLVPRT
jgi:hypothetical protein